MGYSTCIDDYLPLDELQKKLYSKEDLPEAIPYVTSYYERDWGFSISHKQRQELTGGQYRVFIDSKHKKGHLTYAEVVLKSNSKARINKEIFLSN